MFTVKNGRIYLTRGDSARLQVDIANVSDNTEYQLNPEDTLRLSVKRRVNDKDTLFPTKVLKGTNVFTFTPQDTNGIAFGTYWYDVELTTSSNEVYTVIGPNEFEVGQEVTW